MSKWNVLLHIIASISHQVVFKHILLDGYEHWGILSIQSVHSSNIYQLMQMKSMINFCSKNYILNYADISLLSFEKVLQLQSFFGLKYYVTHLQGLAQTSQKKVNNFF